jgi:hypothetical protein
MMFEFVRESLRKQGPRAAKIGCGENDQRLLLSQERTL